MKVKQVMTKKLRTVEPGRSLQFAAQVMLKYDVGSLVVVDSFELVGIVTERDVVKAFASGKPSDIMVKDVMTKKVITIGPEAVLEEAAKVMLKNRIKRLPVCKDNRCFGMVSATDLMKYEDKLADRLISLYMVPGKKTAGSGS